jgi:hypothetical protein
MIASKRMVMCIGPIALVVTDAVVTLVGQSPDYWHGYATVREHNPIAYLLLRFHPLLFAIGVTLWAALFTTAIYFLPIRLARVVALAVMLGHALGTSSWLIQWRFGLLSVLALLIVVRALSDLIWNGAAHATSSVVASGSHVGRGLKTTPLQGVPPAGHRR